MTPQILGLEEEVAPGARRAALALHGAASADRAWMLSRLANEERVVLEPMLAELEALGIPRDPALVKVVLQAPAPVLADILSHADEAAVVAVLDSEPPWLIRMVLFTMPPDRQSTMLDLLSAPRRRLVRELLDAGDSTGPQIAPALQRVIGDQLRSRLPEPVTRSRWARWAARVGVAA